MKPLRTLQFTLQELIEQVESNMEDESIQSNYWDGKYNLRKLEDYLGESLLVIDYTAYVSLADGLMGINFVEVETPNMEDTILLFGVDDIYQVDKEEVKDQIERKQAELVNLQLLKTYFLK